MLKDNLSSWGLLLFVFAVGSSLLAYYSQVIPYTRDVSFWLMLFSIILLLGSMIKDVEEEIHTYIVSTIIVVGLMVLYFMLRHELHRFDFGVGDASDYFIAGVCSVTYGQDIGFFMPLMAAISGVGYDILGLEYTPWINVLLHSMTIPVGYFILRKLGLSSIVALLSSVVIIFAPSSIWFAKTSFSEVLWQTFLLLFIFLSYKVIKKEVIEIKYVLTIWLMMFLVPFIRGEGVLYFGFLTFVALFHFWKHQHFKSALSMLLGLFILSASINITATLRPVYLLEWQFSRMIPHITAEQLSVLLYGISGLVVVLLLGLYVVRNVFSKIKIPLIITILAIVLKITIAYLYAIKKGLVFSDLLFFNEYGMAVNNFGLPLTLLILVGLILLHYHAMKGNFVALLLVVVYIISYVPFVMQAVTFEDVHAFFFYWNRYYFSVIMMIHLFSLGLVFGFISKKLSNIIKNKLYVSALMIAVVLGITFLSINSKLLTIVVNEAHQKNAYKLYPWLKNYVKNNSLVVVYDSSVKYKQNKAHLGNYHLKTLTSRAFSTFKIYTKGWEAVTPDKLKNGYKHKLDTKKNKFVLCLSSDECHLTNNNLVKVDSILLPIEWREHFGLAKNAVDIHHGDVTKSVVNKFDLHAVLYEVQKQVPTNGTVSFITSSNYAKNMLKKGWYGIVNGNGALTTGDKAQLRIRNMGRQTGKAYTLMLQYIVMNASKKKPRTLRFSINGTKIADVVVDSRFNDYNINIPNKLLSTKNAEMLLDIERVDSHGKKLGIILESLRVTEHKRD